MTMNKKNFIMGLLGAIIIFLLGVTYISMPTYYGVEMMENIDVNNLFISFILLYVTINLSIFVILGKNSNNESIYLCIIGGIVGLINVILSNYFTKAFPISFAIFIFMVVGVKLFTIDYYHDRKDAYYYIEGLCLAIFFILGIITAINLFDGTILRTIMLGFFISIIGILRIFNVSIKFMLKDKRFLKKIKLK